MATNILEKSATYIRQVDAAVRARRDVVCGYLKANYKVTRGTDGEVYEKIKADLAAKGIEISESQYDTDKAVFRAVYQWLTAAEDEGKKSVFDKASSMARNVIEAMQADGYRSWDQLGIGEAQPEESGEEAPRPPPRLKLEELEGGRKVLDHFTAMSEEVSRMLEEDERLKEENARVIAENAVLTERISDVEEYNEYADGEIRSLEEKTRGLRDSMRVLMEANLEQIAERYPDYPELAEIAKKIRNGHGQKQQKLTELIARLPREFAWLSNKGTIEYQPSFIRALGDLSAEEQSQLASQLDMLATEGPEYASLHTRKIKYRLPNSPINCFASRVADDIRFTWSKNGHITIHWLFRKGHSRVKQSES